MGTTMHPSHGSSQWRRHISDPQMTVALVTAACLIVEAIVAKNLLDDRRGRINPRSA